MVITIKDIYHKINNSLENSYFPRLEHTSNFHFLGEGAWHKAYLVTIKGFEDLVIRFPKEIAYGKKVVFDEKKLFQEYARNGYYYQQANQAKLGICPRTYSYEVSDELRYTIESFMGNSIEFSKLNKEKCSEYGKQLGNFFRNMERTAPEITGVGDLIIKNEVFIGENNQSLKSNIEQENDMYFTRWASFKRSSYNFPFKNIENKMKYCLKNRHHNISTLTNQDMSPENIVIQNEEIRLIDPRPQVHSGLISAANFINNYKIVFPSYSNVPRYQKHHFNLYTSKLHYLAESFREIFIGNNKEREDLLKVEEFLQLLDLCLEHSEHLSNESYIEQYIRLGSPKDIQKRLNYYIKKLETYPLNIEYVK